jgi:erythromycin esterase-like protein
MRRETKNSYCHTKSGDARTGHGRSLSKPKSDGEKVRVRCRPRPDGKLERAIMLTAEHEAAEVLRHMRLKAYAVGHAGRPSLHWLFALLGWRAISAALRTGSD